MSNIFLQGENWTLVKPIDEGYYISDLGRDFQNYMGDYVRRPPDIFHFAFQEVYELKTGANFHNTFLKVLKGVKIKAQTVSDKLVLFAGQLEILANLTLLKRRYDKLVPFPYECQFVKIVFSQASIICKKRDLEVNLVQGIESLKQNSDGKDYGMIESSFLGFKGALNFAVEVYLNSVITEVVFFSNVHFTTKTVQARRLQYVTNLERMIESYGGILRSRLEPIFRFCPFIFIIAGDYNTRSFSSVIIDERADETEFLIPKEKKKFKKKLKAREKKLKKLKKRPLTTTKSVDLDLQTSSHQESSSIHSEDLIGRRKRGFAFSTQTKTPVKSLVTQSDETIIKPSLKGLKMKSHDDLEQNDSDSDKITPPITLLRATTPKVLPLSKKRPIIIDDLEQSSSEQDLFSSSLVLSKQSKKPTVLSLLEQDDFDTHSFSPTPHVRSRRSSIQSHGETFGRRRRSFVRRGPYQSSMIHDETLGFKEKRTIKHPLSRLDETETMTMDPFFEQPYIKTRKRRSRMVMKAPLIMEDDIDYEADDSSSSSDHLELELTTPLKTTPLKLTTPLKTPTSSEDDIEQTTLQSFKLESTSHELDLDLTTTKPIKSHSSSQELEQTTTKPIKSHSSSQDIEQTTILPMTITPIKAPNSSENSMENLDLDKKEMEVLPRPRFMIQPKTIDFGFEDSSDSDSRRLKKKKKAKKKTKKKYPEKNIYTRKKLIEEGLERLRAREPRPRTSIFDKNPLLTTQKYRKLPKRVYRRSPTIRPRSSRLSPLSSPDFFSSSPLDTPELVRGVHVPSKDPLTISQLDLDTEVDDFQDFLALKEQSLVTVMKKKKKPKKRVRRLQSVMDSTGLQFDLDSSDSDKMEQFDLQTMPISLKATVQPRVLKKDLKKLLESSSDLELEHIPTLKSSPKMPVTRSPLSLTKKPTKDSQQSSTDHELSLELATTPVLLTSHQSSEHDLTTTTTTPPSRTLEKSKKATKLEIQDVNESSSSEHEQITTLTTTPIQLQTTKSSSEHELSVELTKKPVLIPMDSLERTKRITQDQHSDSSEHLEFTPTFKIQSSDSSIDEQTTLKKRVSPLLKHREATVTRKQLPLIEDDLLIGSSLVLDRKPKERKKVTFAPLPISRPPMRLRSGHYMRARGGTIFNPHSSSEDDLGFSIDSDIHSFRSKMRSPRMSSMRRSPFGSAHFSSDDNDLEVLADFRYSFVDIANALNILKSQFESSDDSSDDSDDIEPLDLVHAKKLLRQIKYFDEWDFYFNDKNHEFRLLEGRIEQAWDYANVMAHVQIRESTINFFPTYKLKVSDGKYVYSNSKLNSYTDRITFFATTGNLQMRGRQRQLKRIIRANDADYRVVKFDTKYSDHLPVCHYLTTETGDGRFGIPKAMVRRKLRGIGSSRFIDHEDVDKIPRPIMRSSSPRVKSKQVKSKVVKRMYKEKDIDLFQLSDDEVIEFGLKPPTRLEIEQGTMLRSRRMTMAVPKKSSVEDLEIPKKDSSESVD